MNLSDKIREYYDSLDRGLFMSENKYCSKIDSPFPIGFGQTISQPSLVLQMTQILGPEPDLKTLEIGTGSGYQTALLSKFSREVYTVERIPELYEKAKERLTELGYSNIYYKLGDGTKGWKEFSPYDRIMVTAAAKVIPPQLIEQLASNGRMVIPVEGLFSQELLLIEKDSSGNISKEIITYVRFVPLIED